MGPRLGSLGLALGFAALLAALSLVVWRQSRAMETLRAVEAVRRERALIEGARWELGRRIRFLESRARIDPLARRELGMHVPTGTEEIVLMPVGEDEDRIGGTGDRVGGREDPLRRAGAPSGGSGESERRPRARSGKEDRG